MATIMVEWYGVVEVNERDEYNDDGNGANRKRSAARIAQIACELGKDNIVNGRQTCFIVRLDGTKYVFDVDEDGVGLVAAEPGEGWA